MQIESTYIEQLRKKLQGIAFKNKSKMQNVNVPKEWT